MRCSDPKSDRDVVRDAAISQAGSLFCEVWGEPSTRGKNNWRWGAKNSKSGYVSGDNAGAWSDFEAGASGDLFDLWAVYALGLSSARDDFPSVLAGLAARLGIAGDETDAQRAERERRSADRAAKAQTAAEVEAEAKARVVAAVRSVSRAVSETPALAYLASRGITAKPPVAAVQYHGAYKLARMDGLAFSQAAALVFYATDPQGRITGGQRILLDSEGRKLGVEVSKPTFGALGDSVVRLPATDPAATALHVCEGPETALTIWEATGAEVWAVLGAGRFGAVSLPTDRRVVICPDRDPLGSNAANALAKALFQHHEAGADLWVAHAPEPEGSKRDLNDTAQRDGIKAVRDSLAVADPYMPPARNRLFPTAREFVHWMDCLLPAHAGTARDASLIVAPDHDTAAALHHATGAEVWVLGDIAADLIGEPPRRVIICLPAPDHQLAKVAAQWAETGADVWTTEAPSGDAIREEVFAALRAARVAGDVAPIDLHLPETIPAPVATPDEPKEAIRDRESDRLRDTLGKWVVRHAGTAAAAQELSDRYGRIEVDACLSAQEQAKVRSAAQRKARRAVQAEFGLHDLPSTRRKAIAEGATIPLPGRIHDRIAVTGSQGIGKTAALVGGHGNSGALHRAVGAVTLMLFPTTEKAEEAQADYLAHAPDEDTHPRSVLLRGRGRADPDAPDAPGMCWIPEAAEAAAKRGANVRRDLCMTCPFAMQCGYMLQEWRIEAAAQDPRGAVIFATHPFLTLPIPRGVEPDLVICDEAPSGLIEQVTLSPEDLAADLPEPPLHRLGQSPEEIADRREALSAGLLQYVQPLAANVLSALSDPSGALGALRLAGVDSAVIGKAIATLSDFEDAAAAAAMSAHRDTADPATLDSAIGDTLAAAAAPVAGRLRVLFEAVAAEIDSPNDHATGFVLRAGTVRAWKAKSLHHHRAAFCYLDGTANMTVARAQFGNLVEYRFEVPRKAEIVQVKGRTFSDQSITGMGLTTPKRQAEAESLRADIRDMVATAPGCFVAGTKDVLESLALADLDCRSGNFGALRGVNTFASCTAAIVIGRARPAPKAFEDEARAYAVKLGQTVTTADRYTTTPKTVTDTRGREHLVGVECHPDPFVDAFRAQRVEAEIEQAVDRLRLIHADTPRDVYLLNGYPTVTPDRVLTWDELKTGGSIEDHIEEGGFLPASAREAARVLPDVFGSEFTARAFVNSCESAMNSNKDSLEPIALSPPFLHGAITIQYRAQPTPDHTRPRLQTAYVWGLWSADPNYLRRHVEVYTGPLREFCVLEHDRLAPEVEDTPEPLPEVIPFPVPPAIAAAQRVWVSGPMIPPPIPIPIPKLGMATIDLPRWGGVGNIKNSVVG